MKAVSPVAAAIVLIGIVIAGFAIAYPIVFTRARGAFGGVAALIGAEAHGKAVNLQLVDYNISRSGGTYTVEILDI